MVTVSMVQPLTLQMADYHIWLDDDNMLSPNHVESLVKLVQEKNLDCGIFFP